MQSALHRNKKHFIPNEKKNHIILVFFSFLVVFEILVAITVQNIFYLKIYKNKFFIFKNYFLH
jgi:hypothetical protein